MTIASAALLAHLLQFKLHAAPFATEINPHDAVIILTGGVSSLCEDILDARVVIGGIEPAESRDRPRDHGFDLCIVRDVATNGEHLMAFGGQVLDRGTHSALVQVGQRDGRPRFRESLRRSEAQSRSRAGHQRDFSLE